MPPVLVRLRGISALFPTQSRRFWWFAKAPTKTEASDMMRRCRDLPGIVKSDAIYCIKAAADYTATASHGDLIRPCMVRCRDDYYVHISNASGSMKIGPPKGVWHEVTLPQPWTSKLEMHSSYPFDVIYATRSATAPSPPSPVGWRRRWGTRK